MKLGRLLVRLVIGSLFIGHGTQKLFGWFSGAGPRGTGEMMRKAGLEPPAQHALLAGVTEAAGGALLAAGLATPVAASALIGSMTTAIEAVTAPRGPWITKGGYEYNIVLIAALFDLVDGGPGALSADAALGVRLTGPGWALAALGTGVAAGSAIVALGRRRSRLAAVRAARPDERELSGESVPREPDGSSTVSPAMQPARQS